MHHRHMVGDLILHSALYTMQHITSNLLDEDFEFRATCYNGHYLQIYMTYGTIKAIRRRRMRDNGQRRTAEAARPVSSQRESFPLAD
jgi:hypothetical protein